MNINNITNKVSNKLVIFWDRIKVKNAKTATLILTGTATIWTALNFTLSSDIITSMLSEPVIGYMKTALSITSFIVAAFTAPRTTNDLKKIETDRVKELEPLKEIANRIQSYKDFVTTQNEIKPIVKKPYRRYKRKVVDTIVKTDKPK